MRHPKALARGARGVCGLRASGPERPVPIFFRGSFDMNRITLCGAALLAAVLIGGAGCRDVEKVEIENIFRRPPSRPLPDVPVPIGFQYLERGSYVFNENYRVARLRYTGTPHIEDVVQYYKEQMPLSKWTFVRDAELEARVLTFQNDLEKCTVSLERKGGLTTIEINITPRD